MIYSQNFYIAIILGVIAFIILFVLIRSIFKSPEQNYFDKKRTNSENINFRKPVQNRRLNYPRRPERRF